MFLLYPLLSLIFFLNMSFFHHDEPPNPSKRCKFLRSTLKNCQTFCRRKDSSPSPGGDDSLSSDYNEDEQDVFVSAVLTKYMESKSRRKASYPFDSSSLTFSPTTERLFFSSKEMDGEKENDGEDFYSARLFFSSKERDREKEIDGGEREDFYSADSRLSRCSSATSVGAFVSARLTLSRCSSLSSLKLPSFRRREIIREFRHCEGWPFGLCRKALLLPPLPKSPSESWLTRKTSRLIKLP